MKVVVRSTWLASVAGVASNIVSVIQKTRIDEMDVYHLKDMATTFGGGYVGWQILQTINWSAMGPAAEWAKLAVAMVIIVGGYFAYGQPPTPKPPTPPTPPPPPAA